MGRNLPMGSLTVGEQVALLNSAGVVQPRDASLSGGVSAIQLKNKVSMLNEKKS
jgi:hypothetical protein